MVCEFPPGALQIIQLLTHQTGTQSLDPLEIFASNVAGRPTDDWIAERQGVVGFGSSGVGNRGGGGGLTGFG